MRETQVSEREATPAGAAVDGQERVAAPAPDGEIPAPDGEVPAPTSDSAAAAPENEPSATVPENEASAAGAPVRAALAELDALADAPVAEHPAVYQRVHGVLQNALSAIDDA
jgi:hypothetical protein